MPRYSELAPLASGAAILERKVAAVTIAADAEEPIGVVPFDGYVSAVSYIPVAAYTGADTDYRNFRVQNKGNQSGGVASVIVAALAGTNGNNLVAYQANAIPLAASTPSAPAYAVQPTVTPTAAPTLTNGTGSLTAGVYLVAYSYVVNGVEGPLSPYAWIYQDGSHGIAIAALNLPPGVGTVKWYFLVSPGTAGLFATKTSGAAFTQNAQGNGTNSSAYSAGDVTAGDVLTYRSLHTGSGIADPGGLIRVTITRA